MPLAMAEPRSRPDDHRIQTPPSGKVAPPETYAVYASDCMKHAGSARSLAIDDQHQEPKPINQ